MAVTYKGVGIVFEGYVDPYDNGIVVPLWAEADAEANLTSSQAEKIAAALNKLDVELYTPPLKGKASGKKKV